MGNVSLLKKGEEVQIGGFFFALSNLPLDFPPLPFYNWIVLINQNLGGKKLIKI